MTWNKNHPARSQAFLSRLHDGELSPAERAHFEVHRAHCGQCRAAAADFERALSLFRSARSSPPPADLANRVLRKVQAFGSSRRTPFGSLFSIDLRWAGAFAAALLVLLVATPIILREQKKAFSPDTPIAVALDRPARIVVQPFDALGAAPGLLALREAPSLNDLRGRSFVLVVDGQGRVVDVREAPASKLQADDARRRDGALAKEKNEAASTPLKSLRFQAGERPRRLLVRVE
ncbi:MAG: hypothetical protein ACRD1B_11640 [Thermoanaerobaculia bacterium]